MVSPHIKTIERYCVSCKKNTGNKNSTIKKAKQNRLNPLPSCAVCSKKKWRFINEEVHLTIKLKMNRIINKFLLIRDKFMPKLHLRQPGFTYRACGTFTKHREIIKKFRETGI